MRNFHVFQVFSENNVQTERIFFVQFAMPSCAHIHARAYVRAFYIYPTSGGRSLAYFYFSVVKRCSDPGHPGQRHFSIVKR